MSEKDRQSLFPVNPPIDRLMVEMPLSQTESQQPNGKRQFIFLIAGIFIVLGTIFGGLLFWNRLGKSVETRKTTMLLPTAGFPATVVPTNQSVLSPLPTKEVTDGGASGGVPLIGSSQKLIGVATAMRNLAGMLVQINQIDVCSFPLLKVYATVTDEKGKAFTDTLASDFSLSEDGKEIENFIMKRATDETMPLNVALVIDRSGSMKGEPMVKAKEAAVDFVNRLKSQDQVSVIQFDTEIELVQSPTDDKSLVINKINSITPRSDTALYDVVHFSAENFSGCGRKAVILLTDGRDTASKKHTLEKSINRANEVNVPVFVVGLKSYQFTPEVLRQIAEQTGAQYFEAPTPNDLAEMYKKISGQLEGQYKFEFQSNHSKDDQEHRIRLESHIYGSDTVSEKSYLVL